jgi:ABC-2 type transport system permease protein
MNKTLFKAVLKSNYKLVVIFIAILSMYFLLTASMFDPLNASAMDDLIGTLPDAVLKAFGMITGTSTLLGMMASYFYGSIIFLFPIIFCVITGNRLVARHTDRGSMAYLLTMPVKRRAISATLAAYFMLASTALIAGLTVVGIVGCSAISPGELDIGGFILLNFTALLLALAQSAICFFFSCLFDYSSKALAASASVLIAFFLFNMLSGMSDGFGFLKYVSIFGIFDPMRIIALNAPVILSCCAVYAALTVGLYAGGITVFGKKNFYV